MSLKPTQVVTGLIRVSFEHLMKPKAQNPGKDPKYSVTVLLPKTDSVSIQKIKAAIKAAEAEGLRDKWNGKASAQIPNPVYDGDGLRPSGESFGEECKGMLVFTASSKADMKPEVIDKTGRHIENATEIYSGVWGRVFVNFFPYNTNGRKGIGCSLNGFQKIKDDVPFGGSTMAASEAFGRAELDPITGELIVTPITQEEVPF